MMMASAFFAACVKELRSEKSLCLLLRRFLLARRLAVCRRGWGIVCMQNHVADERARK